MTTVFQLLNEFADALDARAEEISSALTEDAFDIEVKDWMKQQAGASAVYPTGLLAQAIRDTLKGKTDRAPPGIH